MATNTDIRQDPRYGKMTYEMACFIIRKFEAEFKPRFGGDFDRMGRTKEGRLAKSLYALALGWLVLEDRWREAGLDPEFAADLGVRV